MENFRLHNVFDTGSARRHLGFAPSVPFVEGVRRTAAWLDARGAIVASDGDPWQNRVIDAWQRLGDRLTAELPDIDR